MYRVINQRLRQLKTIWLTYINSVDVIHPENFVLAINSSNS